MSGGSTSLTASYVYGNYIDEVLTLRRGSTDYYYHADDQHNVVKLTDNNGDVVEAYDYGDYGLPEFYDATGTLSTANASAVGNPYLFTGRRWDEELGYYYYRNRYMDPVLGRFVSRDPIGLWGDAANLGNGYTYAASNPWSLVDPTGLDGGNQSWWSRLWQWFVTDSLDYSDEATKRRLAKFREDEGPPISPVLPEDYFLDLENPEKVSNSHIYYGALASSEQKNGELAEDVAKRTAEEAAFAAVGGGLGKLGDGLNDARKTGRNVIGFAEGTASDAVRNLGRVDHAGRKLGNLIPGAQHSNAWREAVRENAIRTLENPRATFDHALTEGFRVKGFLGSINGTDVVFFVARETKGKIVAGELVSSWVPTAAQLVDWGL